MADVIIRTEFIPPPIPTRKFDWRAYDDNNPESKQGYGPTRFAAIADLMEQLELGQ